MPRPGLRRVALFAAAGGALFLGAAAPLSIWSVPARAGYGQASSFWVPGWADAHGPAWEALEGSWGAGAAIPGLTLQLLAGEDGHNLLLALSLLAGGAVAGIVACSLWREPSRPRART